MADKSAAHTLTRSGYVPELDTFRLVAIFSVMCLHWLPERCLLNRLQGQVCNGVHLFFVLSGYLITGILLRCRVNVVRETASVGFSFRQFYIRRFLRIFPVYYFVLVIGVLFHFEGLRRGFIWHATYTSNFYYYFRRQFDGPASLFWTLAVEEQFYLIWPLAILTLPKQFILPFVTGIAMLGTVCRIDALVTDSWTRILLPECMNFLSVGSLMAVAESTFCGSSEMRRKMLRGFGVLIALLAISATILIVATGPQRAMSSLVLRSIDQPMMSLVFACLFAISSCGVPGPVGIILRWPPLVYLGRISYGLYVYHLFVTFTLRRLEHVLVENLGPVIGHQIAEGFLSRFALSVLVASASWFLLEKPLNDLKRYFPYARDRLAMAPTGLVKPATRE